jgi:gliding motility-associated-like protein
VYVIGNGIYRIDATTGESDNDWLTFFNEATLYSMVIQGSSIYVGGNSQEGRAMIARLDIETGKVTDPQPVLNDTYLSEGSSVNVLALSDTKVLAGGDFVFDVNGVMRAFYAEYLLSSPDNSPPQIQATTTAGRVNGIVTIDLEPLITDPDNNLDLATLQLMSQFSEQGSAATLDGTTLTLNYGDMTFVGTDHITIGVCDQLNACAEQELTIEVTGNGGEDIVVYNAVSPNGDKKNDFLMLEFIEAFGENKVSIFNRWGSLVFDLSNYNNTDRVFTGINKNGNELPTGTYFYKIEYDGGKRSKNGYLALKR